MVLFYSQVHFVHIVHIGSEAVGRLSQNGPTEN